MNKNIYTSILWFGILVLFIVGDLTAQSIPNDKDLESLYTAIIKSNNPDSIYKEEWLITDVKKNSALFELFTTTNWLILPDSSLDYYLYLDKIYDDIIEGDVVVRIKQRTGGGEIDVFEFYDLNHETAVFNEIDSWIILKQIIGKDEYESLKAKNYDYIDLTRTAFKRTENDNFDIYFDLLDLNTMFYAIDNKYYLSAFGKWGNDNIVMPGWTYEDYVGGISLIKNVGKWGYDIPDWSIYVGISNKSGKPIENNVPEKQLLRSGSSIYTKLSYSLFDDRVENGGMNFEVEAKMSVSDFASNHYGFRDSTDIFTNKNYFSGEVSYYTQGIHDELGQFVIHLGGSVYDIHHLGVIPHRDIEDLEPKSNPEKFNMILFTEFELIKPGESFMHQISAKLLRDFTNNDNYAGITLKFLISNTIGFDLRFFKSLGVPSIPSWRSKEYFVFSPIIRINY